LASPSFTGTPLSITAAVDTNTTQIATTAYVVGQGYLKSATASSTYAPLASPTFSGTPSLPTGTTAVTQTAGNNTTAVATTAFVTTALASADGVVLLGTLTTTSNNIQSLTGLNLTSYKFLRAVFNGVSTVASTWDIYFCGGLVVNSSVNSNAYYGTADVDLANSVVTSVIGAGGGATAQARAEVGTVTNASTTVSVSMGGSSFDAGSIRVYGIR
jgi:hypothetical protein